MAKVGALITPFVAQVRKSDHLCLYFANETNETRKDLKKK